jgi:hypothetical protein
MGALNLDFEESPTPDLPAVSTDQAGEKRLLSWAAEHDSLVSAEVAQPAVQ